jgi:DNA-binding XRE family transcriptional regulator
MDSNNVRKVRETKMLSKTELARHGGISPLTLDRIEKRCPPRSLLAANSSLGLGLKLSQRRESV